MTKLTEALDLKKILPHVCEIAKEAGAVITTFYHQQSFTMTQKQDQTPVTQADLAAHDIILERLNQLTPHIPILSEESAYIPFTTRASWQCYWLVDPLDGTKEFIKHNGEFTVNIALIFQQKSVLGVIYAPISQVIYCATEKGGAFKQEKDSSLSAIKVKKWQGGDIHIAGSRSHTSKGLHQVLEQLGQHQLIQLGSSLKSCLVAEGTLDIYPRYGPTSEWDTAAAQCIVEEAGGMMVDLQKVPLKYNSKESLLNPWFVAVGDKSAKWLDYFLQGST